MDNLNVKSLHKGLNENGYVCDVPFSASVLTSLKAKPIGGAFLYGMAGTGKSYLPQVLSEVMGCPLYVHQCTTGTREEELLVKMMPSDRAKSGVKAEHGKLYSAALASKEQKVILMLDEWDKTRANADGFFLDFLQYGRVSFPGHDIKANLDNMLVFFTANDEREFMEALLRRFPKIDVQPLSTDCVKTALELTHKKHPFIPHSIELYKRCLLSGMAKPATIQELRQLMDAIVELGSGADWDTLVYQFVTKTPENHELLRQAESIDLGRSVTDNSNRTKIDSSKYGNSIKEFLKGSESDYEPLLPRLIDLNEFESEFKSAPIPDKELYGIFKRTDVSTSKMLSVDIEAANDPEVPSLLEWATITNDTVFLHRQARVQDVYSVQELAVSLCGDKQEGEIMLTDKFVTRKEVNRLLAGKWMVKKRDKKEIIARRYFAASRGSGLNKADLRFRADKGLQVIFDVKIGSKVVESIFKLNAKENLLRVKNATTVRFPNLATNIVPSNLYDYVVRGRKETIGISQLKALSEVHNGYCDMIIPYNYEGSKRTMDESDIETLEDTLNIKGIKKRVGSNDLTLYARNITVSLIDAHDGPNSGLMVYISGVPNIDLLAFVVSWAGNVPIYQCGRIKDKYSNGALYERLCNKNGWKVLYHNYNVLHKNGVNALFVDEYVVFCTFVDSDLMGWAQRAGALVKNRMNQLKRCVVNYCE